MWSDHQPDHITVGPHGLLVGPKRVPRQLRAQPKQRQARRPGDRPPDRRDPPIVVALIAVPSSITDSLTVGSSSPD